MCTVSTATYMEIHVNMLYSRARVEQAHDTCSGLAHEPVDS